MARARKMQRFLSQPFHVAEAFTGMPGAYVELKDTIRGFKEVVDGKHDDIPEQAFYMVGTIEQVVEKAKKMAASVTMRQLGNEARRHENEFGHFAGSNRAFRLMPVAVGIDNGRQDQT